MKNFNDQLEQNQTRLKEIFEMILNYNNQRLSFEQSEQFQEAHQLKEEIQLQGDLFKRLSFETIQQSQFLERKQLEQQYDQELVNLEEYWKNELIENEKLNRTTLEGLEKRHLKDLYKYQDQIKSKLNTNQTNKEILNSERAMRVLVKEQRYKEAAQIKKKLMKKVEEQREENFKNANAKFKNLMDNMMKKQDSERLAMEQKLNNLRDDILRKREESFQLIHQKFNVFRDKQETIHNQELLKKKKELENFNASSNLLVPENFQ